MQHFQVTFRQNEIDANGETHISIVLADCARGAILKSLRDDSHHEWRFCRSENGLVSLQETSGNACGCYVARPCWQTVLVCSNGAEEFGEVLFNPDDFRQHCETVLEHGERLDLYEGKTRIDSYGCRVERRVFRNAHTIR